MDSSAYGEVIPEFIRKALLESEFTIIGPGTQTRNFCYVSDTIEMTIKAFETVNNDVLNIGSDEKVTILDLAEMIHKILEKDFKYKILPPREGNPKRRVPDIRKVSRLIGYSPKVSLKEGLMKTIAWYKEV